MNKFLVITLLLLLTGQIKSEPWLDTRDAWLRADIEYLSDIGVIRVPVSTWPLMWAPILNDLNNANVDNLTEAQLRVFKRVKRKGRFETKLDTHSYLSLKAGNQGKILRHFGDDRREKAEITSKTTGVRKNFAWNIEATRTLDPIDGEEQRLDNSYVAGIWGNWVVSLGAQERWWGPGWDSSLILSNNARPVPAISVQRNYSDPFESEWLSWIGPWTFNAFAGQLESDRFIPHAKLLGMSVNFKPIDSLEIVLRRTAQWAGQGRPNDLGNFFDLLIGRDNCDELSGGCGSDRSNEPGNQLAGVDFKWRLPNKLGSVYGQLIGEDEAGYLPSRKVYQFGYSRNFFFGEYFIKSYLEYADSENEFAPNVTYNNSIYQTGYRTDGRSIGSTYDNDTQSLAFGLLVTHKNGDRYKFRLAKIDLNSDGFGIHSINNRNINFNQFELQYQKPTKYGLIGLQIEAKNETVDSFGNQKDKYNLSLSLTMEI
ncbi:capsule assembly Wzi family protein [Kangiella sp. HZ709]|uniref:capsule assembly Wzi family protein n=1 Tax=Kangiella sp. HZ709 TaxID=2666328 RepID=UPI0012B14F3B|nr:capsule assembly Wzi family protein [Kangiella sp. HZ709]MRX27160.1 capsule assembly Wzi family protein [Kangiella sp. HZ709]